MEQQTPEAPAPAPTKDEPEKIDVAVWYRDAAQVLRQRELAWPRLKAQALGAMAMHGWPREALRVAQLVTVLRELEARRADMERLAEAMRLAHHVMGAQAAMALRDLDYLEAQESEFPLAEWPESVRTLGDLLRTGGFAPGPEKCPHCGTEMKALNGEGVWRNAYECQDTSICGLRINGEGEVMCRKCGCTESRACEDSCYWIEDDLCSTCHFSDLADERQDATEDDVAPAPAPEQVAIHDPTEQFPVDPEDGDFSLSVRVVSDNEPDAD